MVEQWEGREGGWGLHPDQTNSFVFCTKLVSPQVHFFCFYTFLRSYTLNVKFTSVTALICLVGWARYSCRPLRLFSASVNYGGFSCSYIFLWWEEDGSHRCFFIFYCLRGFNGVQLEDAYNCWYHKSSRWFKVQSISGKLLQGQLMDFGHRLHGYINRG